MGRAPTWLPQCTLPTATADRTAFLHKSVVIPCLEKLLADHEAQTTPEMRENLHAASMGVQDGPVIYLKDKPTWDESFVNIPEAIQLVKDDKLFFTHLFLAQLVFAVASACVLPLLLPPLSLFL